MDARQHWSVEERLRRRRVPVLIIGRKFNIGQVARDAGHRNGAVAPRLAKVKVERVVLDVLVACVVLFSIISFEFYVDMSVEKTSLTV